MFEIIGWLPLTFWLPPFFANHFKFFVKFCKFYFFPIIFIFYLIFILIFIIFNSTVPGPLPPTNFQSQTEIPRLENFSPRLKFQVQVPGWSIVHVPVTHQSNTCTSTRYKYLVLVPVNQISHSRYLKVPRILLISFDCHLPTQMLHIVQHLGGILYLSIKTCHLSCTFPN